MALRKLFTKRLFDGAKTTPQTAASSDHAIVSPSLPPPQQAIVPPNASKTIFHRDYLTSPENSSSFDGGFFRRFFLRRAVYHSGTARLLSLPVGEKLREKLKGINSAGDRDRLHLAPVPEAGDPVIGSGITVAEVRKVLRASQMEKVKAKLRDIAENSVSYSEFVRICVECSQNHEQGVEFAKMLDDSGNVIVLGNVVFLRPEQVTAPSVLPL